MRQQHDSQSGIAIEQDNKALRRNWLAFAAVAIGSFLGPFSGSIVIVALPTMSTFFSVDMQSIKWVLLVYLASGAVLLPLAGVLGKRFGPSRLFILGFTLFGLGSTWAALSPLHHGLYWLLAARLLQSIGSALLFGVSLALVTHLIPPARRSMAFGIIGSVVSVALIIGQPLGIILCDLLSWRWVFWAQVPVTVVGMVAGLILLPKDTPITTTPLALRNFSVWTVLIIAMTLLGEAYSKGLWQQFLPGTWLIFLLALGGFVLLEFSGTSLFDYSLLRHPAFWRGTVGASLVNMSMYALILLLPFYLIDFHELSTLHKGLLFSLSPVATIFAGPVSGIMADRRGFRLLIIIGLALLTACYFVLAVGIYLDSLAILAVGLTMLGLGGGMFGGPNYSAMMGSARPSSRSVASSFCSLTRSIGFLVGTSVGSLLFGMFLALLGGRRLMLAARTTEIATALTARQFSFAFERVMIVSAILCCIALVFSWSYPNRIIAESEQAA